jgi:uncharacterized membrane protein SirB2
VTLFEGLKLVHVSCAFISIAGFSLRGYWMLTGDSRLRLRVTRIVPHVIDTLLLASAVGMLLIWGVSPLKVDWLSAKLVALLLYILLGMIALRFGRTGLQRTMAWVLALCAAAYIICVAYTRDPMGPWYLLRTINV